MARFVPDFAIVNCILFVKPVPITPTAYVSVSEVLLVPPSTVQLSSVDPDDWKDIVSVAFCAQAVTFNATVADTEAFPFSTVTADAVLPATLSSTVAFSLNAATTILPAEVVPVISLHDPWPVSLNI